MLIQPGMLHHLQLLKYLKDNLSYIGYPKCTTFTLVTQIN